MGQARGAPLVHICALSLQLFCEQQTELEEPRLCQEAFCTILRLVLGTPLADGAELYATLGGIGIHGGLSIGEHLHRQSQERETGGEEEIDREPVKSDGEARCMERQTDGKARYIDGLLVTLSSSSFSLLP